MNKIKSIKKIGFFSREKGVNVLDKNKKKITFKKKKAFFTFNNLILMWSNKYKSF